MRPAPAVTWLDRGVCPPEVRLPVAEPRVRRDERPPVITIGIDPHKRSLTAAALDPHSRLLGQLRLPASSQAATQLLAWAAAWPERRWAVEGATGLGRGVAQVLVTVTAGELVLDVPAKLAARARLLGTSNARKTDLADAASVAAAAIHHRRLRTPDLLRPGRSGLWVAFIGWFLGGAARAEEQLATARGILAGVRVRDAMTPNPVVAPASATVAQLLATSPP